MNCAANPQPDLILSAGPVTLDRLERFVTVEGIEVHLSPLQFAVLEVLLLGQGRTVTHQEISGKVWRGVPAKLGLIQFYMTQLRKALGTGASIIHTVRKEGYVIHTK